MMDTIPPHIKDKVTDKDWSKVFVFETLNDTKAVNKETWLEIELTKQDPLQKHTFKDNSGVAVTKTLSKIIVIRDEIDSCTGIQREYL